MDKYERSWKVLKYYCITVGVIILAAKIYFTLFYDPETDSGQNYSSGSSYYSYYNTYHSNYSGSSGYTGKAAPTTAAAKKYTGSSKTSSSKKSSYSRSTYKDPDDYCDVEGFYNDNRSEFESEDDAWDYLDDEWDDDEWD